MIIQSFLAQTVVLYVVERKAHLAADEEYPAGRSRLEPVGVIVCAMLMAVGSLGVIYDACGSIVEGVTGAPPPLDVSFDTIASLVFNNLFGRFPGLRVLSIENGSSWVPQIMRDLDHVMYYTQPSTRWPGGPLADKPSDILREHLYVSPFYEPYYEAPVAELVEVLGVDRLIFGSDWPHGEGKPAPLDYLDDITDLSAAQTRRFMRDNSLELLGLA